MFRSSRKKPDELEPAEALLREVGARLRQVRMERGEELEDVAQYLRIRPTYLYGLEQGDLSVVPGRTYALGFLRSYAQYLGFDGDDLIAQIRSSVSDLTGKTRLHVRSPLPESRLPKTPILVLSLAALAGIYVGWTYVEHSSRPVAEVVAEMPEELQQLVRDAQPAPAQAPPAQAAPGEAGEAVAVAVVGPGLPVDPLEQAPAPAPAAEIASAPAAGAEVPAAPVAAFPAAQVETEPAGTVAVAPPVEAEAGSPVEPPVESPAGAGAEPLVEPEARSPAQPEADPETAPDLPQAAAILARLEPVATGGDAAPAIYGDATAEPRVILRARSSSWLQVSSTAGDYLWVDTLEPGDAFVVPDRPDLVLWTGNAGGLEVIVDGVPLAPLGPDARVVRDVSLRPEALLQRLPPAPAAGPAPDL